MSKLVCLFVNAQEVKGLQQNLIQLIALSGSGEKGVRAHGGTDIKDGDSRFKHFNLTFLENEGIFF